MRTTVGEFPLPGFFFEKLSGSPPSNFPAHFPSPVHKNSPLKSFKFLNWDKAYIPAPEEHEYVANTTINEK
ncbi:MAG: hypothetical protein CVV30_09785 [Methanomicrobiales archaeon HGW-Methanomicrobiales-1]|jgi:hypothetical protein|nr:MAG: hypothetical protein CVV30_09785 [Methanomicrobiales archaeon HGW-Methanomicrobiales-1]